MQNTRRHSWPAATLPKLAGATILLLDGGGQVDGQRGSQPSQAGLCARGDGSSPQVEAQALLHTPCAPRCPQSAHDTMSAQEHKQTSSSRPLPNQLAILAFLLDKRFHHSLLLWQSRPVSGAVLLMATCAGCSQQSAAGAWRAQAVRQDLPNNSQMSRLLSDLGKPTQ